MGSASVAIRSCLAVSLGLDGSMIWIGSLSRYIGLYSNDSPCLVEAIEAMKKPSGLVFRTPRRYISSVDIIVVLSLE